MWLAEYDIDVYNAPEVFSVPPLTRLILPVMSGHNWLFGISLLVGESRQRGTLLWGAISGSPGREHGSFGTNGTRRNHMYEFQSLKI